MSKISLSCLRKDLIEACFKEGKGLQRGLAHYLKTLSRELLTVLNQLQDQLETEFLLSSMMKTITSQGIKLRIKGLNM